MKIKFNPFLKEVRGRIGNTVVRLCHTGEWQLTARPDMSKVKWSEKQKEHRERFRDAVDYAKDCMKIPELRGYYLKIAHSRNTNRPFDEAVRDYFKDDTLNISRARKKAMLYEQNCAPAAPATTDVPSAQGENVAINEQNRPQRAGFASSSPTKTLPACAGGPATMDDRWIVASLVMSNTMNGENDFYSISTMCFLETANAVGLPH